MMNRTGTIIFLPFMIGMFIVSSLGLGAPQTAQAQSSFSLQGLPSVLINCTGQSGSIGKILSQITGSKTTVVSKVPTVDPDSNYREECSKAIGRYIAKQMMDKITQDTINWINTGFKGEPAYIKNPESMFKSIADKEVESFTKMIAFDRIKFPFGLDTAEALVNSYARTFEQNAQFSLNQYVTTGNADDFYTDFRTGGWNAWNAMVLFPQNNPVGFGLMASNHLAAKTYDPTYGNDIIKIQEELKTSGGFLNQKKCVETMLGGASTFIQDDSQTEGYWKAVALLLVPNEPGYTGEDIIEAQARWCTRYETVTPGKAISDQLTNALGTPLKSIEMADDLNKSLAAIFDALLNQLAKKGLSELTKLNDTTVTGTFGGIGNNASFESQTNNDEIWTTYGSTIDLYKILIEGDDHDNNTSTPNKTLIDIQNDWITMMGNVQNSLSNLIRHVKKLDYWVPGPTPNWREGAMTKAEEAVAVAADPASDTAAYTAQLLDISGITAGVQEASRVNIIEGIMYIFNSYYATIERAYNPAQILESSFMFPYVDGASGLEGVLGYSLTEVKKLPTYEEDRTSNAEDLALAESARNRLLYIRDKIAVLYESLANTTDPNEIAVLDEEIGKYVKIFKQLVPGLKSQEAIDEISTLPGLYGDLTSYIIDLTFEVKKDTWLWPVTRRPYLGAGPDLWPGDPEMNCWNLLRGPKSTDIQPNQTPNVYLGFPQYSTPVAVGPGSNNPAGFMLAGYTPQEFIDEINAHDEAIYAPGPVPPLVQFTGTEGELLTYINSLSGGRRGMDEWGTQGCSFLPQGYTVHNDPAPSFIPNFDPHAMEGEGLGEIDLPPGMGHDAQNVGYKLMWGLKHFGGGSLADAIGNIFDTTNLEKNKQGYSYFEDQAGIY